MIDDLGGEPADTGPSVLALGERVNEPVPQRLLAVATSLFAQRGFENTSVQEIVETAGLTKGAMYHYFDTKDDLLYGIYERILAVQLRRFYEAANTDLPVEERLRASARYVILSTLENLDDSRVFFRSLRHLRRDRLQSVKAARRRYRDRFRALVREGQTSGVFRDDMNPDVVLEFFFGSVHYLGYWYRESGELGPPDVAENFAELLIASLRAVR